MKKFYENILILLFKKINFIQGLGGNVFIISGGFVDSINIVANELYIIVIKTKNKLPTDNISFASNIQLSLNLADFTHHVCLKYMKIRKKSSGH